MYRNICFTTLLFRHAGLFVDSASFFHTKVYEQYYQLRRARLEALICYTLLVFKLPLLHGSLNAKKLL
jgi:hypothetical protein